MNKKALLILLSAAILVIGSALGTMAYLTDTESVQNVFTVGRVGIDLYEHKVDENGEIIKPEEKVTQNTYDDIVPGQTYDKNPTVVVLADSEDSYVRMMVTVTYNEAADAVLAEHNYVSWFDWSDNWIKPAAPTTTKADGKISRTYEFRYKDIVPDTGSADVPLASLFTHIAIPGELTNAELATLEGLKIDVVAHAIQAAGFATADDAWKNFN